MIFQEKNNNTITKIENRHFEFFLFCFLEKDKDPLWASKSNLFNTFAVQS
jgi:hypothetical protein